MAGEHEPSDTMVSPIRMMQDRGGTHAYGAAPAALFQEPNGGDQPAPLDGAGDESHILTLSPETRSHSSFLDPEVSGVGACGGWGVVKAWAGSWSRVCGKRRPVRRTSGVLWRRASGLCVDLRGGVVCVGVCSLVGSKSRPKGSETASVGATQWHLEFFPGKRGCGWAIKGGVGWADDRTHHGLANLPARRLTPAPVLYCHNLAKGHLRQPSPQTPQMWWTNSVDGTSSRPTLFRMECLSLSSPRLQFSASCNPLHCQRQQQVSHLVIPRPMCGGCPYPNQGLQVGPVNRAPFVVVGKGGSGNRKPGVPHLQVCEKESVALHRPLPVFRELHSACSPMDLRHRSHALKHPHTPLPCQPGGGEWVQGIGGCRQQTEQGTG